MFVFIRRLSLLLALTLSSYALTAQAAEPIFAPNGIAINGYDPVAYFSEGKPVKGKDEFKLTWNDAEWRFASATNRDTFKAAPEKYAPQYGGFCAYGVSRGYAVKTEPDAWKIVDNKLYLNYSASVQEKWVQDIPGYITKADKEWPEAQKNRK